MCGFLGEFSNEEEALTPRDRFSQILELSKHRGPDATGIERGPNFQLGFNRLSILDLSPNGNQPKKSPSGRYSVVFNGEIYNFKELAETHQLNTLKSTSDTEVLVHLLDKLGVNSALKALNGMFAIAVVDSKTDTFIITRDFSGIKPLFYGISEKGIAVASQFDQIFKHPWFINNLELRPEIVKEYFGFGYMQAPNTIYKSIFQVNPGECLVFKGNKKVSKEIICTFQPKLKASYSETRETTETYNKKLDTIVKRQLISDVPIATFLSGGIDSPLITAHAKHNKNDIEAITLEVDDATLNESDIAKAYADEMSVTQDIFKVKPTEILNTIDDYFDKCAEPFGDYSSLPTYLLTKHASERFKVMLSGDGGDELFYGYPRFRQFAEHYHLFKLPLWLRKPVVRVLNKLKLSKSSAPFYYQTFGEWQLAKHLHIFKDQLDEICPNTLFSKELLELYNLNDTNSKKELLQKLRHNEFYGHMQRVLTKVDRASMANSLEVRVPFLDKESVAFSWELDSDLPKHKILKKVLKECLEAFVPKELINAQKMGFSVPIDDWLKNELREDVHKHIFETPFYGADVLNVHQIRKFVKAYYDDGFFSSWGVWHIYAWQKWATKHLESIS
ncbi:asparagine synthase (glutamine-hydrolyzing) [Psychroserpens sp. XS_ASV72]|uniref:asparagine synthase (glutamine-hydrolyzing) n=1 Tax=Psychroserpens sp. XS_ASV72 TaxID=3241293 RepID=UPI003511AA18